MRLSKNLKAKLAICELKQKRKEEAGTSINSLQKKAIPQKEVQEVPSSHPVNLAKCWTFSISD